MEWESERIFSCGPLPHQVDLPAADDATPSCGRAQAGGRAMSVSGTKEVDKTILLISEKRTDGRRRQRGGGRGTRKEEAAGRKPKPPRGRKRGRGQARNVTGWG